MKLGVMWSVYFLSKLQGKIKLGFGRASQARTEGNKTQLR
jgi:hypothetical protein